MKYRLDPSAFTCTPEAVKSISQPGVTGWASMISKPGYPGQDNHHRCVWPAVRVLLPQVQLPRVLPMKWYCTATFALFVTVRKYSTDPSAFTCIPGDVKSISAPGVVACTPIIWMPGSDGHESHH